MAVVAFTSAKGAPGVTLTALAATLRWPRPVLLVEADVAGGSSILAGYLRGQVPHSRSLLGLSMALRSDRLREGLWDETVPLAEGRWLVPAADSSGQAANLESLWAPLASELTALDAAGTDAMVDAGRLGGAFGPTPLLRRADAVVLVTRTSLEAVNAVRSRLPTLRADLDSAGTGADALGLLLVGEGHPYTEAEIGKELKVPILGCLAWDPAAARVLSAGAGRPRRFDSSTLLRSTDGLITRLQEQITRRRNRLAQALGDPALPILRGAGRG